MEVEIKIVPWFYSKEWFIVKVRKKGDWFWRTVKEASEDILDKNWHLSKIIMRANESNRKKVLSMFFSWEDYLKYKISEIKKVKTKQKEVDEERRLRKEQLNKFY